MESGSKKQPQLVLMLVDGQWLIGRAVLEGESDVIEVRDVWGVLQQTGLQPSPQGMQIISTPTILVPLLGETGPIEAMSVRPSAAFVPRDQDRWQSKIDDANTATAEARTGLTLTGGVDLQGLDGRPRSG